MNLEDRIGIYSQTLRSCPDLEALSDEQIRALAEKAAGMILEPGSRVFYQADYASSVYFVISGEVTFELPTPSTAGDNCIFGEVGLIRGQLPRHRCGVKAVRRSIIMAVPVTAFTTEMVDTIKPRLMEREAHYTQVNLPR